MFARQKGRGGMLIFSFLTKLIACVIFVFPQSCMHYMLRKKVVLDEACVVVALFTEGVYSNEVKFFN